MLTTLRAIAADMVAPAQQTMECTKQLLDYDVSQNDWVVTYRASNMILAIHSDASYLSESKACSRAGGHFFLLTNSPIPENNDAILNIAKIIHPVMSSTTEAGLGTLFINAKQAIPMQSTLEELGHKQSPTPIQTDNSTASGIVNNKMQPKAMKAMEMRYYWLNDREAQKQLWIYWRRRKTNWADYWTKHHPAVQHASLRNQFFTPLQVVNALRR
jgi:hypothetical protein